MLVAVPQHTAEVRYEGHEPGSNHPQKPSNRNPDRDDTEKCQEDDDRMGRAPYHTAPEADPSARPADRLKKLLNIWHEDGDHTTSRRPLEDPNLAALHDAGRTPCALMTGLAAKPRKSRRPQAPRDGPTPDGSAWRASPPDPKPTLESTRNRTPPIKPFEPPTGDCPKTC